MEQLASLQDKRQAKIFIQETLGNLPPIRTLPMIAHAVRFMAAMQNVFDIDRSTEFRPLFSQLQSLVPALIKTGSAEQKALDSIQRLCSDNKYLADCWSLFAAIAENHQAPWPIRFRFARAIAGTEGTHWSAPPSIVKRAEAVLATLRTNVRQDLAKGATADERAFDVQFALVQGLAAKADEGDQAAARQCVTEIERLRRGGRTQTKLFSKSRVVGQLAECMYMAGNVNGALDIAKRGHTESNDQNLDLSLYGTLSMAYLRTDAVQSLTRVLEDADARVSEYVFEQPYPYLFVWYLGRLFDPKEDVSQIKKGIDKLDRLSDRDFARFALYWRLQLLGRQEEAETVVKDLRDEKVFDEKIKAFAEGTLFRYKEWPNLLVRALLARSPWIDELERYLSQDADAQGNQPYADAPSNQLWPSRRNRLADLYFYRALMDSLLDTAPRRESTLRNGLKRVVDTNALGAIEVGMAHALLKRPDIITPLSSGAPCCASIRE